VPPAVPIPLSPSSSGAAPDWPGVYSDLPGMR
jgi:hypothetical protein